MGPTWRMAGVKVSSSNSQPGLAHSRQFTAGGLPSLPQEGGFLGFLWECGGKKVLQSQAGIAMRALGVGHQLAQGKTPLEPDSLGSNLSSAT